jgi:CubicO group peptidase (beta-lactamase class C family)
MDRFIIRLALLAYPLLLGCGPHVHSGRASSHTTPSTRDAHKEPTVGKLSRDFSARLSAAVEEEFKRHHLASVCVVVFDRQRIAYELCLGQTNREDDLAATLDVPYRWGSNSKLFVMMSILQLVDAGKIKLDDPLLRHVPNFSLGPPAPHHPESVTWQLTDITLRSMLTHHSGIPGEYLPAFLTQRPFALDEFPARIAQLRAQSPTWVAHSYSNLAYTLLGLVVQNVAQVPFAEYVQTHLFAPLDMQSASFEITDQNAAHLARSYDAQGLLLPRYQLSMVPAGGLIASTRDMVQLGRAVLNHGQTTAGPLVSRQLFAAALTRQNAKVALDFDVQQGLAWFINRRPIQRVGPTVEHGGSIAGHHSAFLLSLEHGYGVLCVTNSDQGAQAVQQLAVSALELALKHSAHKSERKRAHAQRPAVTTVAPPSLVQWEGNYTTPFGPAELFAREDRLETEVFGQQVRLKPTRDGSLEIFLHKWAFFDLQPKQIAPFKLRLVRVEERDVIVADTPRGRERLAVRYQPRPASETWLLRAGTYIPVYPRGDFPLVPGVRLSVTAQDTLLAHVVDGISSTAGAPGQPLYIIDEQSAVGQGLGRNQASELRFDQAGRLNVMGLWLKRVDQ